MNASNTDGSTPQTNEFNFQVRETDSLLINGNFEFDEDETPSTPDYWKLKNSTSDKVKCNKPGKVIAGEGNCAFQFKGGVGEKSKIQQSPVLDGIGAEDKLFLSAMIATKKAVAGGKITLKIKYLDAEVSTTKFVVTIEPGTKGYYQFVSDEQNVLSDPKKIVVQASYKGTSGKVWVDNLRLAFEAIILELLPLPSAQ